MKSLIVIGMRGAGKSTMGSIGARTLNWQCIDLDEVLEREQGCSCSEIIERDGWDGFRKLELKVLEKNIKQFPENTVLSCGGGIVETKPARDVLKGYDGPVLHVQRSIDDIVDYLEQKEAAQQQQQPDTVSAAETLARRPKYGESIRKVWERRYPWFVECSTHLYFIPKGDMDWDRAVTNGANFIYRMYYAPTPSILRPGASISSGPASQSEGFDGLLVVPSPDADTLPEELAAIRAQTALPIVLECDSPAILSKALKLNVEVVKTSLPPPTNSGLYNTDFIKPISLPRPFCGTSIKKHISTSGAACLCLVNCAIHTAQEAVNIVTIISESTPLMIDPKTCSGEGLPLALALCFSFGGPSLQSDIEGSDLFRSIAAKTLEHYCLFGSPIQSSPSPAMHNAGFQALELYKQYTLCDSLDIEKVKSVMKSHRFRGASVTIPHKEAVLPLLDHLSDAAKAVGAVNTITVKQGELHGDNTDWFGIYSLLKPTAAATGNALVIGAGGTALAACYCVKQLGLNLFVYNRTTSKAEKVATRFGGNVVNDLDAFGEPLSVIVGTVPASAHFTFPNEKLLRQHTPVVVDVAYRPRKTRLLAQAEDCGCKTFEGIDMLVEQGLQQCRIWTEVEQVPRYAMEYAARNYYVDSDPNAQRYCLFGYPIAHSPSPVMHNTGFQLLRLGKFYELCESSDIAVVEKKLREPSFSGASVTIPHKESVIPYMDELSDAAKSIGAVNTIIKTKDNKLRGDNTDWLGIKALLENSSKKGGERAVVIGAGGTALSACYCVKNMGLDLYIYNRTFEKAEKLAKKFDGKAVRKLEDFREGVDFVISTVPSSSGFVAPQELLTNKPVVVDVAYKPRRTKLLNQAADMGCENFEGIQMLIEQGLHQQLLWNQIDNAPYRSRIEEAVYRYYNST